VAKPSPISATAELLFSYAALAHNCWRAICLR